MGIVTSPIPLTIFIVICSLCTLLAYLIVRNSILRKPLTMISGIDLTFLDFASMYSTFMILVDIYFALKAFDVYLKDWVELAWAWTFLLILYSSMFVMTSSNLLRYCFVSGHSHLTERFTDYITSQLVRLIAFCASLALCFVVWLLGLHPGYFQAVINPKDSIHATEPNVNLFNGLCFSSFVAVNTIILVKIRSEKLKLGHNAKPAFLSAVLLGVGNTFLLMAVGLAALFRDSDFFDVQTSIAILCFPLFTANVMLPFMYVANNHRHHNHARKLLGALISKLRPNRVHPIIE